MKRKLSCIALALSLILSVSACGSKDSAPASTSGAAETAAQSTTADKAEPAAELSMAFLTFGNTPKDMNKVVDEISKISKQKINATLKVEPISIGAYSQQIKLKLASNEKLDLVATGTLGNGTVFDFNGQTKNGQLLAMDELLDKYGSETKKIMSEYLVAGKVDGKQYAIPTLRDEGQGIGLFMRKDLVDKYKIDITKVKTLDDAEAVFKTIKDGEKGISPLMYGQDSINTLVTSVTFPSFDYMGDWFGVLMNASDSSLKLQNLFETPEYANLVKTARKWYTAGYVLPSIATAQDGAYSQLKSGKIFSFFQATKPGIDQQVSLQSGTEVVHAEIYAPVTTTSTVSGFMWGIPASSKNADKAMQFLNLMYTDKDIVNLFDWGIEGKHYEKAADGSIDYPQGVDAKTTGYGLNEGFQFGNQFLSYIWKGDSQDLWKQLDEFNKSAVKSKALGFTFNASKVKTEYTAVSNAWNQYQRGLEDGTVDPDKTLAAFNKKLKDSGIDKVIAEKQAQLDAWAKINAVK